jgi:hypothetical protein
MLLKDKQLALTAAEKEDSTTKDHVITVLLTVVNASTTRNALFATKVMS